MSSSRDRVRPRPTVKDIGHSNQFHAWLDLQNQGVANDYVRVVGPNRTSQCVFLSAALAGSDEEYTPPSVFELDETTGTVHPGPDYDEYMAKRPGLGQYKPSALTSVPPPRPTTSSSESRLSATVEGAANMNKVMHMLDHFTVAVPSSSPPIASFSPSSPVPSVESMISKVKSDHDIVRRLATESLIWKLKQKKAAAGSVAMMEILQIHLTTRESIDNIDVNSADYSGTTLLEILIQLAEEFDRMDDDDSEEVNRYAELISVFTRLTWSTLSIGTAITSPSANGSTGFELAQTAFAQMKKRRLAHNAESNLEGSATALLYGLLKQIAKGQQKSPANAVAIENRHKALFEDPDVRIGSLMG